MSFLSKLFDTNERQLDSFKPIVAKINAFEETVSQLSESEIQRKTTDWKEKFKDLDDDARKAHLDNILPEAFAIVREAAKRTLGKRPYDVQLLSGIVLHQGKISEQKTGEGKTLTATLPLYLNSLTGKGAHLVTPNDYLSRHGAGWMGPLYTYLGISVGVIVSEKSYIYDSVFENSEFQDEYAIRLRPVSRAEAYRCDVVYGTGSDFGFDYLRDNMVYRLEDLVQNNAHGDYGYHNFAIVDEVDSILIDIARTPLIISAPFSQPTQRYLQAADIVKALINTDYDVDEKFRTATLSDLGIRRVEKMLGIANLYEQDFEMVHLIEQALSAHTLYEKDKDYVVKDGKVVIVDQFTGRLLPSNRFSHGLHQALEAKEKVGIQQESRTYAEISYQNYFRLYKKLAGMTGTALTEAEEFYKIYKLDVVAIPTHNPVKRLDHNDMVYKTEAGKFKAVADEVADRYQKGQPVLVGTTSVEKSQMVHEQLKRRNIPHQILNAKNHEKEALIIAQAGRKGSVTVSTNMAGRGVDIILGGDPVDTQEHQEILALGGLHVIGTERHDSRRIDNQLRGRSGRQGDPGSSRFYVSLQDDLMRIFGGEQVERLMTRFGLDDSTPLEAGLVSRAIENAQKKVEGFNFDRRKHVVEMDDVINIHRDVVYKLRRKVLESATDFSAFETWLLTKLSQYYDFDVEAHWTKPKAETGEQVFSQIVAQVALQVLDLYWIEHLVDMDQLREGIGLRGYAQRDPMVEYKREGHQKFEVLIAKIYTAIADRLTKIEIKQVQPAKAQMPMKEANLQYKSAQLESGVRDEMAEGNGNGNLAGSENVSNSNNSSNMPRLQVKPVESGKPQIGRNDPCPCGSGKKYKQCHGR